MERKLTGRGFARYDFVDSYGEECSLQESSAASEPKIWLGVNNPTETVGRMHLTIEQVQELLPILEKFVKTGNI